MSRSMFAVALASTVAVVAAGASESGRPIGSLVFSSTRTANLHGEIVVFDPTRRVSVNLSRHPADDRDAALSPDGRTIAFVSDRGGGPALWTMTTSGRELQRLTAPSRGARSPSVENPRWSPDGARLLYVEGATLFLIPQTGGRPRMIARSADFAWAPDSRRVAVTESSSGQSGVHVTVRDLRGRVLARQNGLLAGWSARGDLATAWRDRLTVERATGGRITVRGMRGAWSPDGTKLAFFRADGIWLLGTSGAPRRAVLARGATSPLVWARDGRSFLYHDRQGRAVILRLGGRPVRLGHGAYSAVWSGDGRLAFGYSSLSVVRPGGRPEVLDRGSAGPCPLIFGSPAWLPDGRLLVVRGHRGLQQADLWRSDGSGAAPRRFLGHANEWEWAPAWSPDGRQIVYERGRTLTHAGGCVGPIEPRLWIASADGRNARPLTDPGDLQDTDPAWSPDGDRIAFGRISLDGDEAGMFVVDVRRGSTRHVTDSYDEGAPSWSPDGERITLSRDGEINVVGVDGTGLRRLVVGRLPAWSPAGNLIAYLRDGELWTVAPDGSDAHPLAPAQDGPSWSPNGRLIAVTAGDRLTLVTPAGSGRTIARGRDIRDLSWSPNGRWLSYVATAPQDRRSELFRVAAAGGRPTQLTRDLALVGRAAWRP